MSRWLGVSCGTNEHAAVVKRVLRAATLFALLLILFGLLIGPHRGRTHAIRDRYLRVVPGSIALLTKLRIGGVDQWVLIRGADRSKPVLLFLHGGPGMANMFLAHTFQRRLERDYVVVEWDRRGAGKSYDARFPEDSLTVRRELQDTYEMTRWLQHHFSQPRIYLLGHSWGSYIGTLAVREHPEYYRAYIGVGQVASDSTKERMVQREWLMRAAFKTNDAALVDRMRNFGDITETDIFRHRGELRTHNSFVPILLASLRSPEYTWADILNIRPGAKFVEEHMKSNVIRGSLEANVQELNIPVFFFLGAYDYTTPSSLAVTYFRRLNAPYKRIVWFPKSAHFPFFEQPQPFATEMQRVQAETEDFWRHRVN